MTVPITHIIISLVVTGMLLGGCSRQHTDDNSTLLRAEALMESHPDSALSILDSLDRSKLRSESDRAFYALLLVQARVKNRMDDANDSLIHAAVDYYSRTGDSRRKMLAYYNLGFLQSGTDSLSQSVTSLLTALDLAEETSDDFYASLACRELSLIFRKTGNPAEELLYAQRAYNHIKQTGRKRYADWAMLDIAGAYHHLRQYDSCYIVYHQLLDTLKSRPDSALLCATWSNLSRAFIADGKSVKALPYLQKLSTSSRMTTDDFGLLGLCLARNGNIQGAQKMLYKADPSSALTHWLRYSISISMGDKDMAFESLMAMQNDSENDILSLMNQRATFSALLHHEQKKLAAQKNAEAARIRAIITALFAVIILIAAGTIIIYMLMRRRAENERNERIAQHLRQALSLRELKEETSKQSEAAMKSILEKTLHDSNNMRIETKHLRDSLGRMETLLSTQTAEHYKSIGKICLLHSSLSSENDVVSSRIAGSLDRLIKDIGKFPQKFEDLETIANMSYDNVMTQLRTSDIDLKEEDYRVYMLSIFGLSSAGIAKLMKINNIRSIYARKYRIQSKLSKSTHPLAPKFRKLFKNDTANN